MQVKRTWLLIIAVVALLIPCGAQTPTDKPKPDLHIFFATTTSLTVSAEDFTPTGGFVTLTATVLFNNSTPVKTGKVTFCDAAATYCTDIHIVATAQLTSSGTATFNYFAAPGNHAYKAVFGGNATYGSSASAEEIMSIPGDYPTTTAVSASGPVGNYTVVATVTGIGGTYLPGGNVELIDTSNGDTQIAMIPLNIIEPAQLTWNNSETIWPAYQPNGPVIADFNLDGVPDLAYGEAGAGDVAIQLGRGNGTFTPASENITQNDVSRLAVADFNNSGAPGLAASEYAAGEATVNNGYGDGRFYGWAFIESGGSSVSSMVAADFDGDGEPDLAILDICGEDDCATPTSTGLVYITGLGGEGTAVEYPVLTTGIEPFGMVTADFNGDGVADLAVANLGDSNGNTLTVFLGAGNGTFTKVVSSPITGNGFPSIATADFNGDGKADLAVVNEYGNSVTILIGNGDGTFTATATSPVTGTFPSAIAVGDFNGDGIPDLAVTNSFDDTVTTLLGRGDGTFTVSPALPTTDDGPNSLAVGDLNGDGTSDLAVANNQGGSVTILLSQATHPVLAVSEIISFPANSGTHKIEARYYGDGLHATSVSTPIVLKSQTTPTITWATPAAITYGTALSAKQLDATASVAGTFAYTPAVGAGLTAGAQTLSVTFTPTDTADYTTATGTVTLTVNQATPVITWPTPAAINSGTALSATQLDAKSSVAGTFVYTPASGTVLAAGSHSLSETFTPSDTGNYKTVTTSVTISVLAGSAITSPAAGSMFSGPSVPFTWSASTGATGYYLWIGSTGAGSNNIYNSALKTVTTYTFTAMPTNGETIYVRLITNFSGTWVSRDYTYTASAQALMTTPVQGATLAGPSVAFTWSAAANATGYYLWIGSTGVGSNNIYNSAEKTVTNYTFTAIPTNGETIYVRLITNHSGTWVSKDYTYTAATQAAITAPTAGAVLTGPSTTFTWSAGVGVTGYYLQVGTTGAGSDNLYNSAQKTVTTYTLAATPTNGEPIYVRLISSFNGVESHADYTYTAATQAAMTSPAAGATFTGASVLFSWSAAPGATAYYLQIGSTGVGSSNIYNSAPKTVTSYTFTNMPVNGETIYVRLITNYSGTWVSHDYTYKAAQ